MFINFTYTTQGHLFMLHPATQFFWKTPRFKKLLKFKHCKYVYPLHADSENVYFSPFLQIFWKILTISGWNSLPFKIFNVQVLSRNSIKLSHYLTFSLMLRYMSVSGNVSTACIFLFPPHVNRKIVHVVSTFLW